MEGSPGREEVASVVTQLLAIDDVAFAEPLVGQYDILITLDTQKPLETVVKRLEQVKPLCNLVPLKANPVLPRERMNRNIEKIPLKA
jgi:transcriptional regulator of NAD metabolism